MITERRGGGAGAARGRQTREGGRVALVGSQVDGAAGKVPGGWGAGVAGSYHMRYDTGWAGDGNKVPSWLHCIDHSCQFGPLLQFLRYILRAHPVDLEICAKAFSLYPPGRGRVRAWARAASRRKANINIRTNGQKNECAKHILDRLTFICGVHRVSTLK